MGGSEEIKKAAGDTVFHASVTESLVVGPTAVSAVSVHAMVNRGCRHFLAFFRQATTDRLQNVWFKEFTVLRIHRVEVGKRPLLGL